jgi:hypothetical protein
VGLGALLLVLEPPQPAIARAKLATKKYER